VEAEEADLPDGARWVAVEAAMLQLDDREAAALAHASGMHRWWTQTRCCGRCGAELAPDAQGKRCGSCGLRARARIDPVVTMLVHHGGSVLLARGQGWPERMYSALAGYVEPGESVEEAVRREVAEEVGLEIDTIEYVDSQVWPGALMLGLLAEAREEGECIVATAELSDVRWLTAAALERAHAEGTVMRLPGRLLAGRLLDRWRASAPPA
jgi:NAD+ diphosphatase